MQKAGLKNYTAGERYGGQGVGVVSRLPWVGMAALAQPVDLCMEWFLTCAGPSSPGKALLGLIWGGTGQQRLIKNFFAEVMLLTSPLYQRIGLSLRFLENKMRNLQVKRLRAACSPRPLISLPLWGPERKRGLSTDCHPGGSLLTKLSPHWQ